LIAPQPDGPVHSKPCCVPAPHNFLQSDWASKAAAYC
jgi:hypothetical protein